MYPDVACHLAEPQTLDFINHQRRMKRQSGRGELQSDELPISKAQWDTELPHKKVEILYNACTTSAETLDALGTIHEVCHWVQ